MRRLVRAQPQGWAVLLLAALLVAVVLGLQLDLARAEDSLGHAEDATAATREEPRPTSGGAGESIIGFTPVAIG